jgi:hypothetical protein
MHKATVTPGVCHHAVLEGPLLPRQRATIDEISAMHAWDDAMRALEQACEADDEDNVVRMLWLEDVGRSGYRKPLDRQPSLDTRGRIGQVVKIDMRTPAPIGAVGEHHRYSPQDRARVHRDTWEMYRTTGNLYETARRMGIARTVARNRIKAYCRAATGATEVRIDRNRVILAA